MRLPQSLIESPFFSFGSIGELEKALGEAVLDEEKAQMVQMAAVGLPPVTSHSVLATMFGINPGLVWSLSNRPWRYYRTFEIPKGNTTRRIDAPKVALKIIQSWLGHQLQRLYAPPQHVFGFVPGRSHITAAKVHCEARWVFSVDIQNFFPSTPQNLVIESLVQLGFPRGGAELLARLVCLRNNLAQGSPASPVLSNICFHAMDQALLEIATKYGVRLTRYADDIVFSGRDDFPEGLREEVINLFNNGQWRLAEHKTHFAALPNRLKVHGLLVQGKTIRLTKGYRKRLRAFRHLLEAELVRTEDIRKVKGHLAYGDFVERNAV